MKKVGASIAAAALLLLAGCEGQADENLAAAAENGVEAVGEGLENVAEDAGNVVEQAGDAVGNQAAKLENGVDVDVDADVNTSDGNNH
jgi:hypothetical protein